MDDRTVHEASIGIAGPLGFIAWVDNQYAIVTPQGQFGSGLVTVPRSQTLILERVEIKSLRTP